MFPVTVAYSRGVCVLAAQSIHPGLSPLPVLLLRRRLSLSWPTRSVILARDDTDHLPLVLEEPARRHVSYVSCHFYAIEQAARTRVVTSAPTVSAYVTCEVEMLGLT